MAPEGAVLDVKGFHLIQCLDRADVEQQALNYIWNLSQDDHKAKYQHKKYLKEPFFILYYYTILYCSLGHLLYKHEIRRKET